MTNHNADLATILSVSGAMISIADVQPVVTMIASIVAIISGIFAIRYYLKATKNLQK
jgi:hypothetical protein